MKDAGPYLGLGVQLAGTMVVWVLGGCFWTGGWKLRRGSP
jgi:hypothetical protein